MSFPISLDGPSFPIVVHCQDAEERDVCARVMAATERAWRVETSELGWDPPLSDGGRCGPDARFDVFVWRGFRAAESDAIAEVPETPWDDRANYLVVDPWGPYGGDRLEATVAHELNHAMQAVHDWNDMPASFEMTAELIEDQVVGRDGPNPAFLEDFQQRPEWSVFHDDAYETWFMYGASLYLFYLRDAVFDGDARFIADVWRGMRNPPGERRPDFIDALGTVLASKGDSLEGSLVGFARWRWRGGPRVEARMDVPGEMRIAPGVEIFGAAYVPIRSPGQDATVRLSIEGDPRVRYVMQAVSGIRNDRDGDPIDDAHPLVFGALPERTVVIVALPREEGDRSLGHTSNSRAPFTLRASAEISPR